MLIGVSIRLPRTVRSIRRVQQIARVLSRHGFGHIVDRLALRGYVPIPRFRPVPTTAAESEQASLGQRLARAFEELGPTFIKLGQLISSRPDVFPPDIVEAMIHLQDQVPPFDTATARKIIEADLGRPLEACFSHFDEVPFASGSIAQVYRATIRPRGGRDAFSLTPHCSGAGGQAAGEQDARPSEAGSATPGRKVHPAGQRVVVKVRRPEIEDVIRLDMTILRWLAELAERVIPEWINYQPVTVVEEFERTILREMDFINEGATVTRFAEAYGYDPAFRIPVVHWELSGPAVLTLEELPGVSVQALINNPDPLVNHKLLAERLALAFVRQYFQIGMFHADPHPGNFVFAPDGTVQNRAGHVDIWQSRPELNDIPPDKQEALRVNRYNRYYWMRINGCQPVPQISIVGEDNFAFYHGEKADVTYLDIKNRDHGQTLDEAFLYWDYFFSGTRRKADGSITHTETILPRKGDAFAIALSRDLDKAWYQNRVCQMSTKAVLWQKLKYHGLNGGQAVRGEPGQNVLVLHQVDAAHAMSGAQRVEGLQQADRPLGHAVDALGNAALKVDGDLLRLVRRGLGADRPLVHGLFRLVPRVLQQAALVAQVP